MGRDGWFSGWFRLGHTGPWNNRSVRASIVAVCTDQWRIHDRVVHDHGPYFGRLEVSAALTRSPPAGAVSPPGTGRRSPKPEESPLRSTESRCPTSSMPGSERRAV